MEIARGHDQTLRRLQRPTGLPGGAVPDTMAASATEPPARVLAHSEYTRVRPGDNEMKSLLAVPILPAVLTPLQCPSRSDEHRAPTFSYSTVIERPSPSCLESPMPKLTPSTSSPLRPSGRGTGPPPWLPGEDPRAASSAPASGAPAAARVSFPWAEKKFDILPCFRFLEVCHPRTKGHTGGRGQRGYDESRSPQERAPRRARDVGPAPSDGA